MFFRSARARGAERVRRLPGDELIREPVGPLTHAVTIRSTPRQIWP